MHIRWHRCYFWISVCIWIASSSEINSASDVAQNENFENSKTVQEPVPQSEDLTQERENERTVEETEQAPSDGAQSGGEPDGNENNKNAESEDDAETDSNVVPPKENIPSYTEFVEPMQGDSDIETADEASNAGGTGQNAPDEHQRKRTGKTTKNYAATECGAKIEKASPDVTSAKHLLTSNKDHYARVPCDKKFSFTVELCEKIQLQRIAVSVNELFASTPSEFLVHAADQAKQEWLEVGRFKIDPTSAKSSSGQSFNVSDTMTHRFVKFLKYEMLSHQSLSDANEPLCVLTSFQAFGHGEHDPIDSTEDSDDDDEDGKDSSTFIGKAIKSIRQVVFPADPDSPTAESPTESPGSKTESIISARRLGILSYHACWGSSVISRECDVGCGDFKDSFFFYYYPGPLAMEPEVEPVVEKPEKTAENPPKMENSAKNETGTEIKSENQPVPEINHSTETQNKTKTDITQTKDGTVPDPNHQMLMKQIYRLEKNLTWMGSYLETLSNTYKKQMDDVRTSFERTQTRLTKVETSELSLNKSVEMMLDMIRHLYLEVNRLDTTLEKIILAASLVIGLQIILILLHCRPTRDRSLHQRLAQIEVTLELLKDTTDKAISASVKQAEEQEAKHRRYSDATVLRTNGIKSKPKKNKQKLNSNRIGIAYKKISNDRSRSGNAFTRIIINRMNVYLTKSAPDREDDVFMAENGQFASVDTSD